MKYANHRIFASPPVAAPLWRLACAATQWRLAGDNTRVSPGALPRAFASHAPPLYGQNGAVRPRAPPLFGAPTRYCRSRSCLFASKAHAGEAKTDGAVTQIITIAKGLRDRVFLFLSIAHFRQCFKLRPATPVPCLTGADLHLIVRMRSNPLIQKPPFFRFLSLRRGSALAVVASRGTWRAPCRPVSLKPVSRPVPYLRSVG